MKLDDLKDMQIPRGELVELGLKRDTFSHLESGVEHSRTVGYFDRIDEHPGKEKVIRMVEGSPTEMLEERGPVVTLYLEILWNELFNGNPVNIPVERIERVCYLTPASR